MSISGLLITLKDKQFSGQVKEMLSNVPALTLGQTHDRYLPAMLEVQSEEEARHWFEWLASVDGVSLVDVVFVSVDTPEYTENFHAVT